PVTPMLMLYRVEESSDDESSVQTPFAWLWSERAFLSAVQAGKHAESEPVHAEVKVPVLTRYQQDFAARERTPAPETVEVIGHPLPGQWVAIRTARGMIWPKGQAE
ncbi:hypothetical protein AB4Z54_23630, partial [Streptomyces sp. MCAF7]